MSTTSTQDKCGFSSFFPMSCRDRAEAFAHHLHSRLRSLGSEDAHDTANETSWLTSHENSVAVAQPRHTTENNLFLNLEFFDTPGSPEEEITEKEFSQIFTNNRDSLEFSAKKKTNGKGLECDAIRDVSQESDDLPYFDTEDDEKEENLLSNGCNDSFADVESVPVKVKDSPESLHQNIFVNGESKSESDVFSSHGSYNDNVSNESSKCDGDCTSLDYSSCADDFKSSSEEISSKLTEFHKPWYLNERDHITSNNYVNHNEITPSANISISKTDVENLNDLEDKNIKEFSVLNKHDPNLKDLKTLESFNLGSSSNENCKPENNNETASNCSETLTDNVINNDNSNCHQTIEESCGDNPNESKFYSLLTVDKKLSIECSVPLDKSSTLSEITVKQTTSAVETFFNKDNDAEENDELRVPRIRRCSSLKTGKTPPGTPGRKKIVRFADVLGLDLADVRTFLDEIPKVPVSAYEDLQGAEFCTPTQSFNSNTYRPNLLVLPVKILTPLFQQPGGLPDFLDIVKEKTVCLENALVKDSVDLSITGTVRVRNLDFNKSVHIRYSLDGWKTFADLQATYVPNSCDGFSDKFTFLIYAHTLKVGQRLEFAVRFHCKGCQYWDNNNGTNYIFQCLPSSSNVTSFPPEPTVEESWGSSFY